jgi:predicted alpha/beta superfamily hydrolase
MTQTHVAHPQDLGPSTVPATSRYRLRSEAIGQDFLIEVATPQVPLAAGRKLPVVYLVDGNLSFGMAASIARMIQFGPFPLPPTLVVGIGYALEPAEAHLAHVLRLRDLSPWPDEVALEQTRAQGFPADIRQGGAGALLEFIETQVKPFIASAYPVQPDDATIAGASLGGLFALHAAFNGDFRRCIAVSPSIWWGGGQMLGLVETAPTGPQHLFIGVGGEEEKHDIRSALVSNCYALEARLRRGRPDIDVGLKVFEGETHMSVFPGAFARGLSEVFGGPGDVSDWSRAIRRD